MKPWMKRAVRLNNILKSPLPKKPAPVTIAQLRKLEPESPLYTVWGGKVETVKFLRLETAGDGSPNIIIRGQYGFAERVTARTSNLEDYYRTREAAEVEACRGRLLIEKEEAKEALGKLLCRHFEELL